MVIKQLSVFLEDKHGRLSELTRILAENNINMSAFSIADSTDYGIVRFVVGRPELALKILREKGFSVHVTDVACMVVPHQPGGLNKALGILADNGIGIDYMYAFASTDLQATVVIHSAEIEKVIDVLQKNKLELLKGSDIYQM